MRFSGPSFKIYTSDESDRWWEEVSLHRGILELIIPENDQLDDFRLATPHEFRDLNTERQGCSCHTKEDSQTFFAS